MAEGRVAIVTGSSRGIGRAIAARLAKLGLTIIMNGTQEEETITDALREVASYGQPVRYVQGDISQPSDRQLIVDYALENYGRIDVLVNNAGVAPKERLDILKTTEESFDYVLGTNLKGTFFLTQTVANIMCRRPPDREDDVSPMIINISSISAHTASMTRGEYCISKAGVSMTTALFAQRLAEYGIKVYEIRPGIIETDMTFSVRDKYSALIAEGLTPIRRWGEPGDVARAVGMLCEGYLCFSTGEVINVDGGFHLRKL